MKIRVYIDVPGYATSSDDVFVNSNPGPKFADVTRYAIDVEVPDPRKPDKVISATPKLVEDKEETE